MSLTTRAALALMCAGGCVQTSSLGHEIPGPVQAGTGDGEGGAHDETTSSPDVDYEELDSDDGESSGAGGTTADDGIELPPSWDPPLGCTSDPLQGLGCLPAAVTDCGVEQGYDTSWWRTTDPHATRLWVAGVYETRSDHSFSYHPLGAGTVRWSIAGSNVLVVSAYEPTLWTIQLEGDGALDRIIATGLHEQTVDAPPGVPVEINTPSTGAAHYACGYKVPGDGEGCEGEDLARFAQVVTGLPISGFDGCYVATDFQFAW